jgi:hypothetical protein
MTDYIFTSQPNQEGGQGAKEGVTSFLLNRGRWKPGPKEKEMTLKEWKQRCGYTTDIYDLPICASCKYFSKIHAYNVDINVRCNYPSIKPFKVGKTSSCRLFERIK